MDDIEELVRLYQNGNTDVCDVIFDALDKPILNKVYFYINKFGYGNELHKEDVEDIFQECNKKLIKEINSYRKEKAGFDTFISIVIISVIKDYLKKDYKRTNNEDGKSVFSKKIKTVSYENINGEDINGDEVLTPDISNSAEDVYIRGNGDTLARWFKDIISYLSGDKRTKIDSIIIFSGRSLAEAYGARIKNSYIIQWQGETFAAANAFADEEWRMKTNANIHVMESLAQRIEDEKLESVIFRVTDEMIIERYSNMKKKVARKEKNFIELYEELYC